MKPRWIITVCILLFMVVLVSACAGKQGPAGIAGPAGPVGPEGPQGPAGKDGAPVEQATAEPSGAEYIGSQICAGCHPAVAEVFTKSGHSWGQVKIVDAKSPIYPFTNFSEPPAGYTWNDISYVIGGFRWKALFVDTNGYIITDAPGTTGNTDYLNQWNLANTILNTNGGWASYKSGVEKLVNNCGQCHTTGYSSWSTDAHQDDLPGIVGTWNQPGVQCEACHGPGSLHARNPQGIQMRIDRSSQVCLKCHNRDNEITVINGLIDHSDTYGDLPSGKHTVLACVDCHDPHQGVVQLREVNQATTLVTCENCHWQQAMFQNNPAHQVMQLACIECHMPRMIQNASGDPAKFLGDVRTHRMAIDPSQIEQFTTISGAGDSQTQEALLQIGLNFACRRCHGGGLGGPKTDEQLLDAAKGYHDQPEPTLIPPTPVPPTPEPTATTAP